MRVGVLGTGNIGTDLVVKLHREPDVDVVLHAGIDRGSQGMQFASDLGVPVTADGVDALVAADPPLDLVFDATSAQAHLSHAGRMLDRGIDLVDLTPAALGPMVVPVVNMQVCATERSVNLVSCAAQATIPLAYAVMTVTPLSYIETVTTISSLSAGPGTRQNIDEFSSKTKKATEELTGVERAKAIAILNPADPPLPMHNTLYGLAAGDIDEDALQRAVEEMAERVRRYVPGYSCDAVIIEGDKITIYNQVTGAGDYLPEYAGNLDIITAAAAAIARDRASRGVSDSGSRPVREQP